MQVASPDKIRNLAVVGHSDTGKTTLTSALLYTTGVANRLLRVEDGNAVTDFDPQEIERRISINLAIAFAPWRQTKINLLDCPGYSIFVTETECGLRASDAALLCVSGASGIEVMTEKMWEIAEQMDLPVVFHITKIDRERADFLGVAESLAARFGRTALPVQLPIGSEHDVTGVIDIVHRQARTYDLDGNGKGRGADIPAELEDAVAEWRGKLIEAVAESDEALMETFFEKGTLDDEELWKGLRRAISQRQIFPITTGSALHGIGTASLLDALVDLLPSPADRGVFPATNLGGQPVEIKCDPAEPVAALVFKTLNDPSSGRLSLLRVTSGTLSSDTTLWNPRVEDSERAGALILAQGKQGSPTPTLVCGDIGAVAKLKVSSTGDTLCAKERAVKLAWFEAPQPAITFALEPKSKGDEEKIGEAITRLLDEDVGLATHRDPQTGEFLLSGAGQLHVEIAVAKLKSRYKVDLILHPPKVPYRETVTTSAEGHGRHKKQTGGRGQFADCKIVIEPLARGEKFEFADEIFGGAIPLNFRPAVEKGIVEAATHGFNTSHPVVDFRVRLIDGQYHDVDSSELAFKIAGSLAWKDAMAKARPTLLEPVMSVEIVTSEEFMGDIMSDLSQRRGRPQGMDARGAHTQVVKALVPLSEMLDYSQALTSMTQGRSSYTMAYSHYEEVPRQIQDKIIAEDRRAREQAAAS
ncbi:MAG TPA: elongation factor G [Thermoanaerobaculia bacterium]|nr:elongation factor G [Thermoanaerobaculia bacterium]